VFLPCRGVPGLSSELSLVRNQIIRYAIRWWGEINRAMTTFGIQRAHGAVQHGGDCRTVWSWSKSWKQVASYQPSRIIISGTFSTITYRSEM
jgi:hypothetical protein